MLGNTHHQTNGSGVPHCHSSFSPMRKVHNTGTRGEVFPNDRSGNRVSPISAASSLSAGSILHGSQLVPEEVRRQKEQQQKVYFQELTRQIHDRDKRMTDNPSQFIKGEISKLPFPWINDEIRLPKYHLKHQIENLTALCENGTYIMGGALQRDEGKLIKQKKEAQQRELKQSLQAQIQERERTRAEVKKAQIQREREEERKLLETNPDNSPVKATEHVLDRTPEQFYRGSPERIVRTEAEPKKNELDYLSKMCKQLMQEQQKLKEQVKDQESLIEQLKGSSFKQAGIAISQDRRNKQPEVARSKTETLNDYPNKKANRIQSAQIGDFSLFEPELPPLVSPVKLTRSFDRHNLDSAGNSHFIYPDAEGGFKFSEKETRKSYESTKWGSEYGRMTLSSFEGNRKNKPMITKGFPMGVFRTKL